MNGKTVIACCMALIVLAPACQVTKVTDGVPNLRQVEPGVWRGGQPTPEGWMHLASLGVTNVLKLNPEAEGSDALAEHLGMTIYRCPITTAQQLGAAQLWDATLRANVCYMLHSNVFVHCQHGNDRTGIAVAMYRVMHDGWTKAAAEKEMLDCGFHKELIGLWDAWEDFQP